MSTQQTCGAAQLHFPAIILAWKGFAGRPSVLMSGQAWAGHGELIPIELSHGLPSGAERERSTRVEGGARANGQGRTGGGG